ncbi:efflux RND transporter periplasmic adaptor subunit [Thalassotalea agarivorans]|uniref:RND family efflux transporter, MFP subunit n=1 Tax=Thalassotalea agarivorans TaxID=349064 RepID=A0A1I0BIV8_THASX|nr:efflux RND transporter periplasmic adaptor subunit [Thalassotalea agarivorans]SET06179.1 RND family efflux transporter, MFP subunit [Thalassotalea agarivorans]
MRQFFTLFFLTAASGLSFASDTTSVTVVEPVATQSANVVTLSGTVEAKQHARLASLQSGVVAQLLVDAGDTVTKGQPLLVLDNKLAKLMVAEREADVAAAKANLSEANRLLQEVLELSKKEVAAKTTIGERRSGVAIATAQLGRANAVLAHQQEELARHTLVAPFDGVIATRNIDVGEWVTQQGVVFTLVEQTLLRVKVAIPQQYYTALKGGDIPVILLPDVIGADPINAKLDAIVKVADSGSRAFSAWANLPANSNLLPGMSAQVRMNIASGSKNVVWLPKSAIKQHPDGGRSIFAVVDNKAKNFPVTIVEQKDNSVAVSGAPGNYPIIISGVAVLRANTQVTITATQDAK